MAIEASDIGLGVAGAGVLTYATGAIGWSESVVERKWDDGEKAVASLKASKIQYQKLREKNLDGHWSDVDEVWEKHSEGKFTTSDAKKQVAALRTEVTEFFEKYVKSNKAYSFLRA